MTLIRFVVVGSVVVALSACGATSASTDSAPSDVDGGTDGGSVMDAAIGDDAFVAPSPDAGPTCIGTAQDCTSATDTTSCGAIQGCAYGQCAGAQTNCHHLVTMTSCLAVNGCTWNGICGGTAQSCGTYADETSCAAQTNCAWGTTSTCSGAAVVCGELGSSDCATQPGCTFGTPDTGL